MEIWREVVGWEGLYEVSTLGRIRSLIRHGRTHLGIRAYGGKLVKTITTAKGYKVVNLTTKGRRKQLLVHRIVLEAFVGLRPEGMEGCHYNGDPTDNRLENLRWDTRIGNSEDKRRHGTIMDGSKNGNHKFTSEQIRDIRSFKVDRRAALSEYGISKTHYTRIIKGIGWPNL